jgi:hypothetical protein
MGEAPGAIREARWAMGEAPGAIREARWAMRESNRGGAGTVEVRTVRCVNGWVQGEATMRAICAVLGYGLFLAQVSSNVDAVTFVTAFRAGAADQYKDRQITGSGMNFHGKVEERLADGSTRTSLVITLGSEVVDGKLQLFKTWEEFVEAERTRTTLVVALSGPHLPQQQGGRPTEYTFAGVYDGQMRTVPRAPQAADSDVPNIGPCAGEQGRNGEPAGLFYCVPLLTGATATVKGG